jgi:hypothetical protein
MTKKKAERHLINSREHLNFLREEYVRAIRMGGEYIGLTLIPEILADIHDTKERIARLERIAR